MTTRKFKDAAAFRASLEGRIKLVSRKKGMDLQRLRREVGFDRLLARLFSGKNPPWYLKGSYAMELRIEGARTTKDMDMGRSLGPDENAMGPELLEEIQELASKELGDFFEFRIGAPILELDATYGGYRYPVEARVDGRTFVKFHLDLGIGDPKTGIFEELKAVDWLGFAGIAAPVFPAISQEQHFAETIHAYTKLREGRENSRVRDLVDMVPLIEEAGLEKSKVKKAIEKTFNGRDTHAKPDKLKVPPASWEKSFKEIASECGLKITFRDAYNKVSEYYVGL